MIAPWPFVVYTLSLVLGFRMLWQAFSKAVR